MSEPLVAAGRITLPITIDGVLHKLRLYCTDPALIGGVWKISTRNAGPDDLAWTAAAARFVYRVTPAYWGSAILGDVYLESRSGLLWTTIATDTIAMTGGGSAEGKGIQVTWVFRDTAFKKVKMVMEEPQSLALAHFTSVSSVTGGFGTCLAGFLSTATDPADPYFWMCSRGNRYLNSTPFVGLTFATNRKMRRRRGLT